MWAARWAGRLTIRHRNTNQHPSQVQHAPISTSLARPRALSISFTPILCHSSTAAQQRLFLAQSILHRARLQRNLICPNLLPHIAPDITYTTSCLLCLVSLACTSCSVVKKSPRKKWTKSKSRTFYKHKVNLIFMTIFITHQIFTFLSLVSHDYYRSFQLADITLLAYF